MVRNEIESAAIAAVCEKAKSFGYQFFTAKSGGYGLCALPDGSRCIYFGFNAPSYELYVSMELKPSLSTGSGYRIAVVDLKHLSKNSFKNWFSSSPPVWAGGNSNWGYRNLVDYLQFYKGLYKDEN